MERPVALSVEGRSKGVLLLRLRAVDDCTLELQHAYGETFGWRPGEELHLPSRLAASFAYPWAKYEKPFFVLLDVRDVGVNAFELAQLQKQLVLERGDPAGLMADEHGPYQESIAHTFRDVP